MTERPAETAAGNRPAPTDVDDLHALVLQSLDDDQAVEVVTIPLAGKSNIADHMVIASGPLDAPGGVDGDQARRQDQGAVRKTVRIEGLPAADWVLIDADDVIVHIFRPEVRNFYNLERMWAFGDDLGVNAATRVRHMRLNALLCRSWRLSRSPLLRRARRACRASSSN